MKQPMQWVTFVLSLVAFAVVGWLCQKHTDGFTRLKIENNFFDETATPLPLSPKARTLLAQEFRYYKRGAQSFVFLSEDRTCVLKVFNNRLKRQRTLLDHLPFSFAKKKGIEERLETTYKSYHIAATTLQEETGVLYANLSPNPDPAISITLIDKLGIKHEISLNTCSFLLQAKSELVYPLIKRRMQQGDVEGARALITSLIALVSSCHTKGVVNEDPSIRKNFGVRGGRCQVIDVGRLVEDDALETRAQAQKVHHFRRFRKWLKKKYPELLDHFDTRIAA